MASAVSQAPSFLEKHQFLLTRLHSLSGVVPLGVFLINHLLTNSTAWLGPEKFNEHVEWIHSLPYLLAIEIVGIFLPLAFHAAYGVVIAVRSKPNVAEYRYADNIRYWFQRVTAWIALLFIVVHLLHYRFAHWVGGPEYKAAPDFFDITYAGFQQSFLPAAIWAVVYFVGLLATVYHLCNGLCTFCITWGITVGDIARKRMTYVAGALFALLMLWGTLSIVAMLIPKPAAAMPHTSGAELAAGKR